MFDQVILAGGNFGATVLFARWLEVEDFAVVATALTVWFFVEAVQRTGILTPYIASTPDIHEDQEQHTMWFVVNLWFVVLSVLGIGLLGLLLDGLPRKILILSAFIVPSAAMFFYFRRIYYHIEHYWTALCLSVINMMVLYGGIALVYWQLVDMNAATVGLVYASAFLLPALGAGIGLRSTFSFANNLRPRIRQRFPMIAKMSVGAVATYFYNNGVQLVLAMAALPIQVAAFSAMRVMARPLSVIITAVNDVEYSLASRAFSAGGLQALDRLMWRVSALLGAAILMPGIVLYIFTGTIIEVLFAGKYSAFIPEARLWLLALLPQLISIPLDIKHTVMQNVSKLMWARVFAAIASLSALVIMWTVTGSLTAAEAIYAVMLGRTVMLVGLLVRG